ncbi:T6SS immunity protein Tdi1 domain-containing protein [Mesonia maritima]|uniref:T6SS immunity protein Tdi1 C-terminal domain-containing protein n=1 Tax=Mesonia maritima TaxID=1793873 RepID=A0ABU1K9L8_9FLAO|nr:T6SS immunity protein Tdi1 domain-containing protein [Mesonia maritima]MDR6302300.1 hypothetical protein [Mesonia maritima]
MLELFKSKNKKDDILFSLERKQDSIFDKKFKDKDDLSILFSNYGGTSYNRGMFRIHNKTSALYWTSIVTDFFPQYKNKICCFSYDWMGRQFAIDITDPKKNYLFDAATGEDFELPQTLNGFFNEELVDYRDDTLIPEDFNDILKKLKIDILSPNKCIGYKQLLFLGGEDNLDNTEVIDMDIYWNMNYQIYSKIHKMKKRNIINNIKYE